jgi:hypothetical protein
MRNDRDHQDDLDDREDPELVSSVRSSVDLIACPFCSKACHELADICPHCHNFIGREPRLFHKSWLFLIAALLALLAMLSWVVPLVW